MAIGIPNALKSADIARFAQRAAQAKSEYADDDSISDVAGQAYVEQFGLEIFQRAENAMRANKVTKQTADTFLASATFLELNQIWAPLDPEVSSKMKFAKYHALRIAKAIKAGEDPNLSNPVLDPPPQEQLSLNPADPEVQLINSASNQQAPFQPSVEEVPDEIDRIEHHLAQRSSIDQSLHPSRAPSIPRQPENMHSNNDRPVSPTISGEDYYQTSSVVDISPINSSPPGRDASIGGGYFPKTFENAPGTNPGQTLNTQPNNFNILPPSLPETSNLQSATKMPPPFPQKPLNLRADSVHSIPTPNPSLTMTQDQPPMNIPSYPAGPGTAAFSTPVAPHPTQNPVHQLRQAPAQAPFSPPAQSFKETSSLVDEEAMLKAQKHAKWAISALNFEDVNTAIKELQGALRSLGAG
ncbi:MAG: hypothetical protein Q9214_003275 [Letrouitia sp. 1 TL-2023]